MAGPELAALLDDELRQGTFPSYQARVVDRGETVFARAGGYAVLEPERREASADTLYDLASLTKPLVTALAALRLAEEGVLALDVPLSRLLPELCAPGLEEVTALDLLTHRAGLKAWAPLYLAVRPGSRPPLARLVKEALKLPLEYPPRTRVVYSDLGYLLLGASLERVSGKSFADLASRTLKDALGGLAATDAGFPPSAELKPRTAATERGNAYECKLAGAAPSDPRFRQAMLWGEVHDGNAGCLGGVAPHAGLFGTARAVVRIAAEYLDAGEMLGPAARALARTDLTAQTGCHRSAAWECATNPGSGGEGVLAKDAIGHSGFTGTSVWLEPARERVYVLLTNRVHPEARDVNMNAVRRRFHAAARDVGA